MHKNKKKNRKYTEIKKIYTKQLKKQRKQTDVKTNTDVFFQYILNRLLISGISFLLVTLLTILAFLILV